MLDGFSIFALNWSFSMCIFIGLDIFLASSTAYTMYDRIHTGWIHVHQTVVYSVGYFGHFLRKVIEYFAEFVCTGKYHPNGDKVALRRRVTRDSNNFL